MDNLNETIRFLTSGHICLEVQFIFILISIFHSRFVFVASLGSFILFFVRLDCASCGNSKHITVTLGLFVLKHIKVRLTRWARRITNKVVFFFNFPDKQTLNSKLFETQINNQESHFCFPRYVGNKVRKPFYVEFIFTRVSLIILVEYSNVFNISCHITGTQDPSISIHYPEQLTTRHSYTVYISDGKDQWGTFRSLEIITNCPLKHIHTYCMSKVVKQCGC